MRAKKVDPHKIRRRKVGVVIKINLPGKIQQQPQQKTNDNWILSGCFIMIPVILAVTTKLRPDSILS